MVLVDDADCIGEGSRGLCYSKRALEIWDRLGCGERMVAQGVTWKVGKVFLKEELLYQFDLLPEDGHKMPAFINLQQYYLEKHLVTRVGEVEGVDLRWRNKVTAVAPTADHVRVTIETPDGPYQIDADWVIAADGARSPLRDMMGLQFKGLTFEEKFLIADIRMAAEFPTERWFWFDPVFHPNQSALMHRQPDDMWRIDLHLGLDADIEEEQKPERVVPRLKRMLGDRPFELEWISIYRFNCRRIDKFVHGRVIFAGDAAHQVSPFGARGANSGVQDTDNLAWKLAAVIKGEAPATLIDSYDVERIQAADENIGHSTRSTEFVAADLPAVRGIRDAALALARTTEFARRMVNAGRLSTPCTYVSPLTTPDEAPLAGSARLGAPLPDAPVRTRDGRDGYLLENLSGEFEVLYVKDGARPNVPEGVRLSVIGEDLIDTTGALMQRLDATPGATYVLRPDQHLTARFRSFDGAEVRRAVDRALGK